MPCSAAISGGVWRCSALAGRGHGHHRAFRRAIVLAAKASGEEMRRIVVTGMGAVSPLAAGVEASWSRLLAGRSGIRRLPDEVVADLPTKIGGVVPSIDEDPDAGFDPRTVMTPKDQRKVDRFILFAATRRVLPHHSGDPLPPARLSSTAAKLYLAGLRPRAALSEAHRFPAFLDRQSGWPTLSGASRPPSADCASGVQIR
jgi:hypothetical protein